MIAAARRRFPGQPDQVAKARRFVRTHSGLCPMLDEAVLLTSELCTNAVRHSMSGEGGFFEVAVHRGPDSLRIEVRDDGSETGPVVRDFDELAESGRGLEIVGLVAARWGQSSDEFGHLVFFELSWPAAAQDPEVKPARVSRFAHPIQQPPRPYPALATATADKRVNRLVSPQEWSVVLDGEQLRGLRRQRGMSQEALCSESGVSIDTIARLERGRRPVCRGRTAGRLARALGVAPLSLLAPEQTGRPASPGESPA
jgi:anti-sigma regulatory factor (Ser/Thr protein kinase)/DNA-binding XRE family transcriptional regulator